MRSPSPARRTVIEPTLALPILGLKTITRAETISITVTAVVKGTRLSPSRALGRAKPVVASLTSTGTRMESRLKFTRAGTYKISASAARPNDNLRSVNGTQRLT